MRPKTSLFFTSREAARAGDGVHNLIRNAASAKFLFEVFPTLFASDDAGVLECKGEATTAGIETHPDAIAHFWLALEKAEVSEPKTRERVKTYWDSKLDEPCDYWDNVSFYSARHQQEIHVVLPLKKVFIAVASLLLGNQYFDKADASAARSARLTQLFDNLQQVAEHSGLCHTGVRDALLTPLNGVNFWLNDEKQCYRFPEHLSTYLQSLLSQYIEQALRQLGEEKPDQHRDRMIAWFKMPDDEREMPDDLKVIVNAYLQSPEVQADYRTALLHVGLNPKSPDVKTQCEYIFSSEGLALINPSAALGSQAYWRDLELLFSLKPSPDSHHLVTLQSEAGRTHGKEAIQAFQARLKDFFRIQLAQSLLKTFELTLRYHYPEEAPTLCDTARAGIAEYHRSEAPPCLTDAQREALRQLQALVKRYQAKPLNNSFSNGFALLFQGNLRRKQARLLASRGMVRKFNITDSWLDHFFPGDKPAGFELNIELPTLNQVLLYALYYPQDTWPDRYSAVLTICLDYIEHKLGISEETRTEREDHQRLKQNSYPEALLTLLHLLNDSEALAALSDAAVKKQVDFCLKNNFYNALVIIHRLHRDRVDAHLTATHALTKLITENFLESFKVILEHSNIDINLTNRDRCAPLYWAAKLNRPEHMAMLLEKASIDINKTNNFETPLMIAAFLGHHRCVALLVNHRGIDINYQRDNHDSALIMAAERGHDQCVQIILEHRDCDVNARGSLNRTALIKAADYGHTKCLELLLDQPEINVNTKDKHGNTALILAARLGYTECLKLLLDQPEINVNTKDKHGNTALIYAATLGHTKCLKLLLDHPKINVNTKDNHGSTALIFAVKYDYTECIKLLLERSEIEVNAKNKGGETALLAAAYFNRHKCVQRLLRRDEIELEQVLTARKVTTRGALTLNGNRETVVLLDEWIRAKTSAPHRQARSYNPRLSSSHPTTSNERIEEKGDDHPPMRCVIL